MSDPHPTPAAHTPQPAQLSRRGMLALAASAPVVTATGLGLTPSTAQAAPLPLTPPDTVDNYDVGDSIVQTSAPTMPLVKLSLGSDGTYTFEMPRLEQGTGIATALAMMIAEEAGVPLSKVKVLSADAQPELLYNQITGGSSTVRSFEPPRTALASCSRQRARSRCSVRSGPTS